MSQAKEFHKLADPSDGLFRELAPGLTTRIFAGEHAMLSVVTLAPNSEGVMHHHPEEQWGVLLDGSAIRFQGGEEIQVKKGDFWRTPGNVPHTMRARHLQPTAAGIQKGRLGLRSRVIKNGKTSKAEFDAGLDGPQIATVF